MYSYCTTLDNKSVHLGASTEVELLTKEQLVIHLGFHFATIYGSIDDPEDLSDRIFSEQCEKFDKYSLIELLKMSEAINKLHKRYIESING
jgi:hypothetical protein